MLIYDISYIMKYMPHISDKKLEEKYYYKLYSQLIMVFDTAGRNSKSSNLLDELLTETEKVMFAKRIATVCLLQEGVSKPYISELLLISPSTVDRISLQYEIGNYSCLVDIIKNNNKTIWGVLENFIHNSVSKQVGKRRTKWMDIIETKHNKKIF